MLELPYLLSERAVEVTHVILDLSSLFVDVFDLHQRRHTMTYL